MKHSKKLYALLTFLFIVVFAMACAFLFACGKNEDKTNDSDKTEDEQTETGGDTTEPESEGTDDGEGNNPGGTTPAEHQHSYVYVASSDENNPNYAWEETDGGWACTVTLTCEADDGAECDTPTKTDAATVTLDTAQDSQKDPTCTEDGYATYRATYNGSVIATKVVSIEKLGHSYEGVTPEWSWPIVSAAGQTVGVTVSIKCARCQNVWTSGPVQASYVPTTGSEEAKYTVTITGPDGVEYTDTQLATDVLLPGIEVNFSDGSSYAWINDFVVDENNNTTNTIASGKTFTTGILSLTSSAEGTTGAMTIVGAGNSEGGYLQTGGKTQNGEEYFAIDLSKYVGYNVSVSVKFGGANSNQTRYLLLGTSPTANTPDDSNVFAIAFSEGQSDVQTLKYVITITESTQTLYITWNDNLRIYEIQISVSEDAQPTPAIEGLTLTSNKTDNCVDTSDSDPTITLTMNVTMVAPETNYTGGYTITVTQTPEKEGEVVASVDDKGDGTLEVTALGAGSVTIAVQLWDDPSKKESITITVTAPDPIVGTWEASNVTISFGVNGPGVPTTADIQLVFTKDGEFTMTIYNVNTQNSDVASNYETFKTYYGVNANGSISVSEFTWSGSYEKGYTFTGSVSDGNMSGDVSAQVEGELLRFQYDQVQHMNAAVDGNSSSADLMISFGTVSFCKEGSTYVVDSIEISQTTMTLPKNNGSATLTATVTMARGEYNDDYKWEILNDSGVVSISGTGASVEVRALTAGTATIQLTAGGKTLTCTVIVIAVESVTLAIGNGDELKIINQTATLTATVAVENGTDEYTGGYKWATSNSSIVSVSKSSTSSPTNYITLTVKGAGTATITVTLDDGSQATYSVTIEQHTHTYTITNWTWNDDNTCTVTATCGNSDGLCWAVDITASAAVMNEYFEATCTRDGYTKYTASYTPENGVAQTWGETKIVIDPDAPAFGHSYETKYLQTTDGVGTEGWYLVCATCGDIVTVTTGYGYTFEAVDLTQFNAALAYEGATIVLGFDVNNAITISEGQNVTIDLNGHTITAGNDGENTVTVETDAYLRVMDSNGGGAIKNIYAETTSLDNAAAIFTTGTFIFESGSIESTSVGIRAQGGEVTINGGTISTTYFTIWEDKGVVTVTINGGVIKGKNKGIFVSGDSNFGYEDKSWQNGAFTVLIVDGGTISSKYDSAISTLGYTSAASAYIEINGGTIYSEYRDDDTCGDGSSSTRIPAIYLANGTLVITGGDISGATALEVRGGHVTITGGTFNTTAQSANTPEYQGSGATSYGYALAIYPFGTANGRYTGTANGTADTSFDWTTTVLISGGTFNGALFGAAETTYTLNGTAYDIGYTLEISGGAFASDPTPYLAAGYTASAPEDTGSDFYIVTLTAVTVSTYEELVTALETSSEIVLGADISGTITIKTGTEIVLNLNGKTLSYDGSNAGIADGTDYVTAYTIIVEKGASLKVMDNVDETSDAAGEMGSIVLSYDKASTAYSDMKYARRFAAIKSEGTLVIEGGCIKSTSVGIVVEGNETYTVGGVVTGGYLYVHGGCIDAEEYSIFEGAGENVVVYIDGGTVSGGRGIVLGGDSYFGYDFNSGARNWQNGAKTTLNVYDGAVIVSSGRSAISTIGYANASSTYVNIYGGTIMGEDLSSDNAVLSDTTDFATLYIANGHLTVYGGIITGTYAVSVAGGTVKIYGGTFTSTGMGAYDQISNPDKPAAYALSVVFNGPLSPSGRTNVDNALEVKIYDGTFTGVIVWDDSAASETLAASFAILGGCYSEDPSEYLGDGLVAYKLTDKETEETDLIGYYKVTSGAAIVVDDLVADGTLPEITSSTSVNISESTVIYRGNGTKMTVVTTGSSYAGVRSDKTSYSKNDDVSFTHGIYFSGAMDTAKRHIRLEVSGACTVIFYGLTSSSSKTFKLTGGINVDDVKDSYTTSKSNTMYEIHLRLEEAGTYLLGADAACWIFALTVAYDPEPEEEYGNAEDQEWKEEGSDENLTGTGLLTIDDMIAGGLLSADTNFASGTTPIYEGEDGTVISVISNGSNSKTPSSGAGYGTCVTDGKTFTNCINLNGSMATSGKSIELKVTGACTVVVYGMTTNANKNIIIKDETCTDTINSYNTVAGNTLYRFELSIESAGTYLLGGDGTAWIFAIEIVYN